MPCCEAGADRIPSCTYITAELDVEAELLPRWVCTVRWIYAANERKATLNTDHSSVARWQTQWGQILMRQACTSCRARQARMA